MSEILDLAQKFKNTSNKTVATIETALQDDLKKLQESFTESLGESEIIIKKGMESLDEKKTNLQESLGKHHEAINKIFSDHITSLQTLSTESLKDQKIEIAKMMSDYSQELSEKMQSHQANALNFIDRRAWAVVIFFAMFALLPMAFGLIIGMKLR